jgi:hypothetical protein
MMANYQDLGAKVLLPTIQAVTVGLGCLPIHPAQRSSDPVAVHVYKRRSPDDLPGLLPLNRISLCQIKPIPVKSVVEYSLLPFLLLNLNLGQNNANEGRLPAAIAADIYHCFIYCLSNVTKRHYNTAASIQNRDIADPNKYQFFTNMQLNLALMKVKCRIDDVSKSDPELTFILSSHYPV